MEKIEPENLKEAYKMAGRSFNGFMVLNDGTGMAQQLGGIEPEKWQRKPSLEGQSVMYSMGGGTDGVRGSRV
jgi:hypothetical protein